MERMRVDFKIVVLLLGVFFFLFMSGFILYKQLSLFSKDIPENVISGNVVEDNYQETQETKKNSGVELIGNTIQTPSGLAYYCTQEQKLVESCSLEDNPVCGWFDLELVNCDPGDPCVRSVFPNVCEACSVQHILYWTPGDCPIHN